MKLIGIAGLGFFLAGLSACDPGPEQQVQPAPARLPPNICTQIHSGLQQLQAKAALVVDRPGEATIADDGWLALAAPQRDRIATLLAFDAACLAKEPPREVNVTIRNEFGRTLTQRTVPVTASLEDIDLE